MKKFVLAVLPLTALLTGCQNICEINAKLKPEAARLGIQIHAASFGTPDIQKVVCNEIEQPKTGWDSKLAKVSAALLQTADRDLRYVEEVCTRSHLERRCGWIYPPYARPGFPGDYPQEWRCTDIRVCDDLQRIERKRPGYDQALALSKDALELKGTLLEACENLKAEKQVDATLSFLRAKAIFNTAEHTMAELDTQASCSERKGN